MSAEPRRLKKLDFWYLPPIIIFQLKRFSFTGNAALKTHGHVDFPLRGLDLSEMVIGPHPDSHDMMYDLYGVVEHRGCQKSGHYTAYCFNQPDSSWYFCNDSTVQVCTTAEVEDASAYILFYVICSPYSLCCFYVLFSTYSLYHSCEYKHLFHVFFCIVYMLYIYIYIFFILFSYRK